MMADHRTDAHSGIRSAFDACELLQAHPSPATEPLVNTAQPLQNTTEVPSELATSLDDIDTHGNAVFSSADWPVLTLKILSDPSTASRSVALCIAAAHGNCPAITKLAGACQGADQARQLLSTRVDLHGTRQRTLGTPSNAATAATASDTDTDNGKGVPSDETTWLQLTAQMPEPPTGKVLDPGSTSIRNLEAAEEILDLKGVTALHIAAAVGTAAAVEMLLEAARGSGSPVKQQVCAWRDSKGWTAWHYAAARGDLQMLESMASFSRRAFHQRVAVPPLNFAGEPYSPPSPAEKSVAQEQQQGDADPPADGEVAVVVVDALQYGQQVFPQQQVPHDLDDGLSAPLLPPSMANAQCKIPPGENTVDLQWMSAPAPRVTPADLLTGASKDWWDNGPGKEEQDQLRALYQLSTIVLVVTGVLTMVPLFFLLAASWAPDRTSDSTIFSIDGSYEGGIIYSIERSLGAWVFYVLHAVALLFALSGLKLGPRLAAASTIIHPASSRACGAASGMLGCCNLSVYSRLAAACPRFFGWKVSHHAALRQLTPSELDKCMGRWLDWGFSQLHWALVCEIAAFASLAYTGIEHGGMFAFRGGTAHMVVLDKVAVVALLAMLAAGGALLCPVAVSIMGWKATTTPGSCPGHPKPFAGIVVIDTAVV